MQKALILLFFILIQINLWGQQLELPQLDPNSLKEEFSALFDELKIKHPGYYRYNDKADFDHYIDSTLNTFNQPINELEALRKIKPIFAKIGCLHTGIHLSEETEERLNQNPNCLPLSLYHDEGRFFIWKKFGNENPLQIGDEVTKINGRNIRAIYATLLSNIPMDGYNQTGKIRLLQYTFPQWYRNIIEVTDEFNIETKNGKIFKIKGVKADELLDYKDIVNEPMSLKFTDNIAIIRIPSFSNSYLKSQNQKFRKEIKQYFKIIQKEGVDTILFDLRKNTGGSDSNPAWLARFFFEQPFEYWEKITVTEPIAKDVSGFNSIFYGKPKKKNGEWHWGKGGLISKEFKYRGKLKPVKKQFKGKVFILTDGLCMSSCADFTAIMQHNKKATVIGEETGGGYQGNTSGLIPSEELECGLVVDVPLLIYFNAVEKELNFGRGTQPDILMTPSLNEIERDSDFQNRFIKTIKEIN